MAGGLAALLAAGAGAGLVARAGPRWGAGVRDVLQLRLAALPQRTTELLQTAAVDGRRVTSTCSRPWPTTRSTTWSRRWWPACWLSRLRFVHDLLHETVLGATPPLRRARLHGQLGRLLARVGDPQPDELAEHFFAAAPAGFADEVFGAALTAADHCLRVGAHDRAAEHLERARSLIDRLPRTASRNERELRVAARLGAL